MGPGFHRLWGPKVSKRRERVQRGEPEVGVSRALVSALRSPCFRVDSLGNLTPQSPHVALLRSRTHMRRSVSWQRQERPREWCSPPSPQAGAGNLQCSSSQLKENRLTFGPLMKRGGEGAEQGACAGKPRWETVNGTRPGSPECSGTRRGPAELLTFQAWLGCLCCPSNVCKHLKVTPDVLRGCRGSNNGCGNPSWGTAYCPGCREGNRVRLRQVIEPTGCDGGNRDRQMPKDQDGR